MSRRKTRGRRRGQALVEFALVFPILILVLVAIVDVGRAVFLYNSLTNAAREGARLAIVNQYKPDIVTRVEEVVVGGAVSNAGLPDDLVSFHRQGPNTDALTNPLCDPNKIAVGCVAVVTARSDWSAITPLIGQIIGPIPFVARSELPVELTCPNPDILAYTAVSSCPVR